MDNGRANVKKGTTMADSRRLVRWLLIAVVVSVLLGLAADALFGWAFPLTPDAIERWLSGAGPWAPLLYIGAMIVAVVVSPIPSVPLDIAAGLTFGLIRGSVYTLVGAEIGAIVAFLISRRLGRPWLARRPAPDTILQIDELDVRLGMRALIVMRLLPVFNFDWVSYAAGLISISLPRFATLIGMTPPVIAITAVGSTYGDNPVLSLSILAVLVLLVVGPLVVWRIRSRVRPLPEEV